MLNNVWLLKLNVKQFYARKTGLWLDLVEMRWQVRLWPVTNTTLTSSCCPAQRFM